MTKIIQNDDSFDWITFAENIYPIWLTIVILYLPSILFLKHVQLDISNHKHVTIFNFFWNFSLSLLSLIGLIVAIYDLYKSNKLQMIFSLTFTYTEFPPYFKNVISIFSLTKVIEFGDTFLLILKKRKLSFLHVFHHLTVSVYCYFSLIESSPLDQVFCIMNLFVHSLMYAYFAYSTFFKNARCLRPLITSLQIMQMIIGVICSVVNLVANDRNTPLNIGCFLMYGSYFVLFVKFAHQEYIIK
jgi:hypothetical protein